MTNVRPEEIIARGENDEFLKEFIETANTGETGLANAFRVAGEVYLAKMLSDTQEAANGITNALKAAARAARCHSLALVVATLALVGATIALVVVTALSGT